MNTYTMPMDANPSLQAEIGVVVIGRNEGQRLANCLKSLRPHSQRTIYVDSGSSDRSIETAALLCAGVVLMDMKLPLTAARAKNAGFDALMKLWPDTTFVQFLDGDCEMDASWIKSATEFLSAHNELALVFGRRRELYPQGTIFNAICDRGGDTGAGEVTECGREILIRADALNKVGGYSNELVAGEEPELCVRLREKGWKIWRLPLEMTRHAAKISGFSRWWKRSVLSGYAYAQVSNLHRKSPFRIWRQNVHRAVLWGGILPAIAIGGLVFHSASLTLLLAYPLLVLHLARSQPTNDPNRWPFAIFEALGNFAEMQGIAQFHIDRLIGRQKQIAEQK